MHKVCLAKTVGEDSKEALTAFIKHRKPVQKGDHFYRQNDDFVSVYVVRSGAVKNGYCWCCSLWSHQVLQLVSP